MNKQELFKVLDNVHEYYDRFEVTQKRIDSWHEILKDYDFNVVMKNLKKYSTTSKFPPTIADLLEGQYRELRPYDLTPEEIKAKQQAELDLEKQKELVKEQNKEFMKIHGCTMGEYYGRKFKAGIQGH